MATTTKTSTQPLVCENCDAALGRLDDAFVWLDRAVCRQCFKRLSASRSVKYRGVWMPLAIAGLVAAAVAVAALVVVLMRPPAVALGTAEAANSPQAPVRLRARAQRHRPLRQPRSRSAHPRPAPSSSLGGWSTRAGNGAPLTPSFPARTG